MKKITEILQKYDFSEDEIINYGKYIAKLDIPIIPAPKKDSKLILVTSINPTPYGEGKTTMLIGLVDALNRLGKQAIGVLREPSLGPVFGLKGGATGGGLAKVIPEENINLHFTGDIHAITSANNLLCAIIDNHIYNGNNLDIQKVTISRVLDVNDRALRNLTINSKYTRDEHFTLSVASELMAILCLAIDLEDLKNRISQIIIGFNSKNHPIYVKDLQATDALTILLKDAINPNAVQTLEENLCLIHGGPFANIAHGAPSIRAINLALTESSYTVVEAGFGSDLGGEKFLDIVCPNIHKFPNLIVINVTIRSLKHNGGILKEDMEKEDLTKLKLGFPNLEAHISNMSLYSHNILVVLNKFITDTSNEIKLVEDFVKSKNLPFVVCDSYNSGSQGGLEFAKKVIEFTSNNLIKPLYSNDMSIKEKITILATKIYHASSVSYTATAEQKIELLTNLGLDKYHICVAKTPNSLSDNSKLLGNPTNYQIHVTDIKIANGAEMIIVYMGNIITMPGLAKESCYLKMKIDKNGQIEGMN